MLHNLRRLMFFMCNATGVHCTRTRLVLISDFGPNIPRQVAPGSTAWRVLGLQMELRIYWTSSHEETTRGGPPAWIGQLRGLSLLVIGCHKRSLVARCAWTPLGGTALSE
jgi:hypothetical protein